MTAMCAPASEQEAFRGLYEDSWPEVSWHQRHRCGDQNLAEDLTAEVFLEAVREWRASRAEMVTVPRGDGESDVMRTGSPPTTAASEPTVATTTGTTPATSVEPPPGGCGARRGARAAGRLRAVGATGYDLDDAEAAQRALGQATLARTVGPDGAVWHIVVCVGVVRFDPDDGTTTVFPLDGSLGDQLPPTSRSIQTDASPAAWYESEEGARSGP